MVILKCHESPPTNAYVTAHNNDNITLNMRANVANNNSKMINVNVAISQRNDIEV